MQHQHARATVFTTALSTALCTVALGACQPVLNETHRVALADDVAGRDLVGLSSDPASNAVFVLSVDEGVARVDIDGALVDENRYGDNGLVFDAYQELAVDDDGTVYLLADVEGFRFRPDAQMLESHFCVLPGDDVGGPIPGEVAPIRWQENDALTLIDDTLIAAPRFFEEGTVDPVEALLSSYRASDGEPTGTIDITSLGLDIRALAATKSRIYALSDGAIQVFSRQGAHLGAVTVDATADPRAMTLHGEDIVILDGDALVFFSRATIDAQL